MKTLEPPTMEPRPTPPADDAAQVIDTSKMNAGQRAALEVAQRYLHQVDKPVEQGWDEFAKGHQVVLVVAVAGGFTPAQA